jgi:electron transport complex protein RnfD
MSTRGVSSRGAIALLALLPGVVLQCVDGGAALMQRLGLAVLLALAMESISLRIRAQPLRPFLSEGSAVISAVLVVLWLPSLEGWRLACSVFVAVVVARHAFGGLGAQVFNPVMAAIAVAQVAFASAPALADGADATALAWLLGGLALCALRIVRWQTPLALLAGACLALLVTGRDPLAIASAPWLLAAFFIASDSASGCEQARARWLFAFATGVLAIITAPDVAHATLPFALLAMNALAPALDRWLEPHRVAAP